MLASEGHLLPNQADRLRLLAPQRNRLAHGELQVTLSKPELMELAEILDGLIDLAAQTV
jgi:hypothetical protein